MAALSYAETYGIVEYKVVGRYMIYYQNYNDKEFRAGGWRSKTYTMKRTVDLDNMKTTSEKLNRLNKIGWVNV